MPDTLTTTLHAYRFDVRDPEQRRAYAALKSQLLDTHPRRMKAWSPGKIGAYCRLGERLDGQAIELETRYLFNNQWNSAPIAGVSESGVRVFDWAADYFPDAPHLKAGYYLEQTDAMRELRRNTHACGYCGHQERAERGSVFCPKCPGSEYLKPEDLHLLRMVPVEDTGDRGPLSDAELAHLLPIYNDAQHARRLADGQRVADKIQADYDDAVTLAREKRDGMLWVHEHLPDLLANVLYYKHTQRFGFGWRTPLTDDEVWRVLDVITEFPFGYEIKTADGRRLERAA